MDNNLSQPTVTFERLKERLGRRDKASSNALKAQEQALRFLFLGAPRHLVNLFGRSHALLTLTPKSIGEPKLQTLTATQPVVEFTLDLSSNIYLSLDTQSWTGQGTRFSTGIHIPNLAWPPFCVVCLSEATDYKVVEIAVRKGSFGKWSVNADQDTANRIAKAALYDRYWLPLPCCRDHFNKLSGMDLSHHDSKVTLLFGNPVYAGLFQYLNPSLRGLFKSQDCRKGELKSNTIIVIAVLLILITICVAFLFGSSNKDAIIPTIAVASAVVVLGVGGIVYARRLLKQHEQPVPFDIAQHSQM